MNFIGRRTTIFNLNPGYHSIYNNDPSATFMAIAFGNAQHNSYAYACGSRMALVNAVSMSLIMYLDPCKMTINSPVMEVSMAITA
jgi:hypothetical protein